MPDWSWMKGLPEALAKAVSDNPFQYALMLRDGTIVEFEGAAPPSGGWILATPAKDSEPRLRRLLGTRN
jgi:hypothetical protein